MNITIEEVHTSQELHKFIIFPFKLYNNSQYWVPPIIREEKSNLNASKNPLFKDIEAHLFVAKSDEEIVGRIAAIINWVEVKKLNKPKIRFGWFDFIDNEDVSQLLLDRVQLIGREHGLEYMEGPVGFSNLDRAGMLVMGFEQINNITTHYNYPYFPNHMERLGFSKGLEWVEYRMAVPKEVPDKVRRLSQLVLDRYKLRLLKLKSTSQILTYAKKIFDLVNLSYSSLESCVPIQPYQIEVYTNKFLKFVNPDFVCLIVDKQDRLVGFSLSMPSFAKAMQKANGRLFPFGFLHLLRAQKNNDVVNLFLIGIDPKYQRKGLTGAIFQDQTETFNKYGLKVMETNPELEENKAVQLLWKNFNPTLIKRWCTYKKNL
ncbi:MAG: GTP cyclohydrolase [Xenococcus sp. (in: cyanobacteria)]